MSSSLFVGFGANLASARFGAPVDTCRWAIKQVVSLSWVTLEDVSSWYRSASVPVSGQPDFINAVIKLSGNVEPAQFLAQLHGIEMEAGRVRGATNAARVLDLDLLAVDDLVLPGPGLILPHPRLAERAFVLHPLCDIEPGWLHPVLGLTATELRERLAPQRIERLPETKEDLLLPIRAPR